MLGKKRRFRGGEIPTSSMADIAFLLLIFFLVTTTIDMDKGLGLVLPAEGEEIEINKKNILNCLINSSGNVLLGGDPVEIRNLSRTVRQKIAENNTQIDLLDEIAKKKSPKAKRKIKPKKLIKKKKKPRASPNIPRVRYKK